MSKIDTVAIPGADVIGTSWGALPTLDMIANDKPGDFSLHATVAGVIVAFLKFHKTLESRSDKWRESSYE